jgi:AcrR family transcriptional regulator
MVRQARSEATRRRIIDAAVELINERGYPAAGLPDIIEHAEMTKGALYYHFDSKETLATAIMEEGASTLLAAFGATGDSTSPAIEMIISGVFATADLIESVPVVRAAVRLMRTFGPFNPAARGFYERLMSDMNDRVRAGTSEGDVRSDVDPETIAVTIVGMMLSAELLSDALSNHRDLRARLARMWGPTLPVVVSEESLPYYREFLARRALRDTSSGP